jgi:transposase-like protein
MPHKGKVSVEIKLRLCRAYLDGDCSIIEAAQQAGVDRESMKMWIRNYKAEGIDGLTPKTRCKTYPATLKLAAVTEYLVGDDSLSDICVKFEIRSKRTLRQWIKRYNSHGEFHTNSGGSHMTKPRKTTQQERIEIVRHCITNGNNYGEAAITYKVSYQQVYLWTQKYRKMGEPGLEDRRGHRAGTLPGRTAEEELRDRIAELERKNYDLEMENVLLKKLDELERRDALVLRATKENTK